MSLKLLQPVRWLFEAVYGLCAVGVFLILGFTAFLLMLVPGFSMNARRAIAHWIARAYFACAGIRIRTVNMSALPAGQCVVVANHASYLDGVVLKGVLPARFSFVIKKEVSRVPLAGLLLRRIGSEFVDRFNRHAGGMDARRIIKAADAGQALAFFPEGTFLAEPGLGKFHTGAFVIAARARLSVVPVVIRGTRHILPSGRFLPRPGRIEVEVLPTIPIPQDIDSSVAATMIRDEARAGILAALDEPDLGVTEGVAPLDRVRQQ